MAVTEQTTEQSFNQRYYEVLRRAKVVDAAGRLAVSATWMDTLKTYERRQYDELVSGFSEALLGRVDTHYAFMAENGQLVAGDGEPIANLMERGRQEAVDLAASDKFYKPFLIDRARHESDELAEQEAMARGETDFNTMVAVSPYSEEYATDGVSRDKLLLAAQRPDWRRAMIRLSHWDGERLHVLTRSIDNSNLDLLREAVGRSTGYAYRAEDSTAMLGERIKMNFTGESWRQLPDEIVAAADDILAERNGGTWLQGRPLAEAKDVLAFVESHAEVVEALIAEGRHIAVEASSYQEFERAFNQKIYNYAALLEARLAKDDTRPIENIGAASCAAGSMARSEGKSYNMCGYQLAATAEEAAAAESGFETIKHLMHEKVTCPACGQKTTVPEDKLRQGHLQCRNCQYEVDVCTGHVYQEAQLPEPAFAEPEPDLFDILAQDLKRYSLEAARKQQSDPVED